MFPFLSQSERSNRASEQAGERRSAPGVSNKRKEVEGVGEGRASLGGGEIFLLLPHSSACSFVLFFLAMPATQSNCIHADWNDRSISACRFNFNPNKRRRIFFKSTNSIKLTAQGMISCSLVTINQPETKHNPGISTLPTESYTTKIYTHLCCS